MNETELDDKIRALVRMMEAGPPPNLAKDAAIKKRVDSHRGFFRWVSILGVVAAALALALGTAVLVRHPAAPELSISEIRTDWEIPGKDIRVIFVQRSDFRLVEGEGR